MKIILMTFPFVLSATITWANTHSDSLKCTARLLDSNYKEIILAEAPSRGTTVEILHSEVIGIPQLEIEIIYKNNIVSQVIAYNRATGKELKKKVFDDSGKLKSKIVSTIESDLLLHVRGSQYVANKKLFTEHTAGGELIKHIDQRTGKLSKWKVGKVTLTYTTGKTQRYTVNATMNKLTVISKHAHLITESGELLAQVGVIKGLMHGAYLMYDPKDTSKVMITGQYNYGAPVGVWKYGLSRSNLEKTTIEFDENGNEIFIFNPNTSEMLVEYNENNLKVREIMKYKTNNQLLEIIYEPYSEQILAINQYHPNGKKIISTHYSRLTGKPKVILYPNNKKTIH